jgi:hypothetical protein
MDISVEGGYISSIDVSVQAISCHLMEAINKALWTDGNLGGLLSFSTALVQLSHPSLLIIFLSPIKYIYIYIFFLGR